jgi:Ras GTPase-activating-like protein IQGAP2/3
MLSAYARRGQGLSILKDILEQPLRSLTSRKDLNLEINPAKVYTQMITDSETKTGRASDLPLNVSDEVAAANPEVIRIIEQRAAELLKLSDYILQRIITSGDSIPYGMRWICKTLADLAKRRFPDIDRYQCGSLMGGYIYLRFFNPVIVTPDAVNFISTKPNRVVRRNLILVCPNSHTASYFLDAILIRGYTSCDRLQKYCKTYQTVSSLVTVRKCT